MSAIDHEFKPDPHPEYDGLLKQFRALLLAYNSARKESSFLRQTSHDLQQTLKDGALDSVDSQREANAILTNELEALKAERDQ